MVVQTAQPLLRLLLMLAGLALVGVAFIVGAVLFAVFLGAAMILVVLVWLRAQLLGGLRGRRSGDRQARGGAGSQDVIEGEYQVRAERRDRDSDERRRR